MRVLIRPRPITFWLRWLVIVGVLPAWLVTALMILTSYQRERATLERGTVGTARAVMEAVDRDLAGTIAALRALATSPHLASGNIAAFHQQAREVLATQAGDAIVLTDATGEQIMNTLRPHGEKLPRTGAPDLLRVVFESAQPAISDFFVGVTSGQGLVAAGVPVIRDGRVVYNLTMGMLPEHLNDLLRNEHLSPEWMVSIFDRKGTIVARTHAADRSVGQKGSPALLRQIAEVQAGTAMVETDEGTPVLAAFSRSDFSGWAVAIGIPVAVLTADLRRSLWFSIAAASFGFLFALFVAQRLSLRIARSIRALSAPALALASDAPIVVPRVQIQEVEEVGRALERAGHLLAERTIARDCAEARARAQQAELAHVSRVSLAGEMAAGIAHELSQPLTAISAFGRGCMRILASPIPDLALVRDGMGELVQQAERAGDVLIRLREFVRYGVIQRRSVPVRPLIDTAVALVRTEAMQAQVDIEVRSDPDLPAVFADNIQIQQVLLNLLRNAIEAMVEAGSARRSIVVEAGRKGERAIEISVADTGPGISEEISERVFQPFTTTKPRGMGMGLSISRTIIEAHGGSLQVIRNGRNGTVFAFDLPIYDIEEAGHAG